MKAKVFVVTGATDGIGKFTAEKLGRDGHTVVVHGRTKSKVDAVVKTIGSSGGVGHGFVADLSSMEEVRRLGGEIGARFETIDGLLNNAGTFAGDYTGKRVVTSEAGSGFKGPRVDSLERERERSARLHHVARPRVRIREGRPVGPRGTSTRWR